MQDDLLDLAVGVSRTTSQKVGLIEQIMGRANIIALNARIEAARAGDGAFKVVAQEMSEVANQIRDIARELRVSVAQQIEQVEQAGATLLRDFHGTRLVDLAANAIEMLDRNLYERSCDVRWWATDSALVAALGGRMPADLAHAEERLAVILRSYTVYLDLWLIDPAGRVVACGRGAQHQHARGSSVAQEAWFKAALATRSGDDYAVGDISRMPALDDRTVATYATAVRTEGRAEGAVQGVLAIFFDWTPQAASILQGVRLSEEERRQIRILIVDAQHRIIATSDERSDLFGRFPLRTEQGRCGFYEAADGMVGYALTPGFETYKGLGWHAVLQQRNGAGSRL
jgi:Methyl-accepting chemotaxis protein (MCP) signalling domain